MPDAANLSISQNIREQYHCDANGRVLFFTSPPLDPLPLYKEGASTGHSPRYLAAKVEREKLLKEKRKRAESEQHERELEQKRARDESQQTWDIAIRDLSQKAVGLFEQQMVNHLEKDYRLLAPDDRQNGMNAN